MAQSYMDVHRDLEVDVRTVLGLELCNFVIETVDRLHVLSNMTIDVEDVPGDDFSLDLGRPLRINQGVLRIFEVDGSRGDANNHDCLAITSQRKFK